MLSCERVTLAVPGRVLVRGLSFEARRGELWAVLGPNGSGKTTLLHALAGLAPPLSGAVALAGRALARLSARERAALLGLLPQHESADYWGPVLDYVRLGRFARAGAWLGWSRADEAAARAALAAVELDAAAARSYRTLSGGERQRARIAQLLAQDPQALLLDEPLQHLDLRHQVGALRLLGALARERGRAVLVVLHEPLWPARLFTHALLLYGDGTFECGAAPELLSRDRLERLYGCRLEQHGAALERVFAPIL